MGGRFSHVHYRAQDAVVVAHFQLLTQVWTLEEIELLSLRLRRLSFNFCLTGDQFAELLTLHDHHHGAGGLFAGMLTKWFDTFKNTKNSTVINGLELLSALAIASTHGKLTDKLGTVFDVFDFDGSHLITFDELNILIKSVVRGLSKLTVGLGPRLMTLCPMAEVQALARQCFQHCDLEEEDDLSRESFIQWVKQTPKVVNLMRCFVRPEFITEDEAAATIQRCARGMHGRKIVAEKRLARQMELDEEVNHAAQTIQEAVITRKQKRDNMRQMKIEKFAHHGALYTFGSNARAQLGYAGTENAKTIHTAPVLVTHFKNNELRVIDGGISSVHAGVVTSNGEMFTWGSGVPGSFGSLSRRHEQDMTGVHVRKTPTRVQDLEYAGIAACALGNHHSVALSESGVVYAWGAGSFGQLGHGDFRTDSHDIFKQQFDQHTGKEYPFVDLPLQIDRSYFEEMRVLQIACGYYFTVTLCEDGSVFTWGEGSDGQLGLGYSDKFQVGFLDEHIHSSSFVFMHSPTRVDELKEPISEIAVGGNHVFAVARDHKNVYEWGAWGRRGADAQESTFSPQLNELLSSLSIHQIASGKEHALAIGSRVDFTLTVDNDRSRPPKTLQSFSLCALFGAPPVSLARALSGALFMYGAIPSGASTSSRPSTQASRVEMSGSATTAMLASTVLERKESQIRANLAGCTGKIVFLDRSMWTGFWILVPMEHSSPAFTKTMLEIPSVPAAFGPTLTENGITTKIWYSPEKLRSLKLYVRPDEVVSRVVVLVFEAEDITFAADDMDLSEMITLIMISLVEKVKDAQECGAAAVVIVFDFLDADAFPLEAAEDEQFEFTIPVVVVKKAVHGELLLEQIAKPGKAKYACLCHREDILGRQILTAQKNGAKAVVVAQNRIDQHPVRLRKTIFEVGSTMKASDALGVKIPVVMIPFEVGEQVKAAIHGVDMDDTTAELGLGTPGLLYAWGYGENGRLGLGDMDNEELFDTGFDGARQTHYQFVAHAEVVQQLFYQKITHVACGEDHSAAVSVDGVLYCWGSGRDGKLGNGRENDELMPYPVESLGSVRVAKAVCGPHHTFAITVTPSVKSPKT